MHQRSEPPTTSRHELGIYNLCYKVFEPQRCTGNRTTSNSTRASRWGGHQATNGRLAVSALYRPRGVAIRAPRSCRFCTYACYVRPLQASPTISSKPQLLSVLLSLDQPHRKHLLVKVKFPCPTWWVDLDRHSPTSYKLA
jgi:hypothetical protein